MKAIIKNSIVIFALVFIFTYCKEANENEDEHMEEGLVEWNNQALLKSAEKYYMDSTYKIKRTSLLVVDERKKLTNHNNLPEDVFKKRQEEFMKNSKKSRLFLMRRLVFHQADTLNLHKVGKEVAWLPVIMLDRNKIDTLVVDYKVTWQGDKKQFEVTEIVIQKVNDEKRYEWLEDDGYWEKQLVRDTDF